MRNEVARAFAAVAGLLALASLALPANAETLRFAPRLFADTPHTANIVDADGDGRLEIPGLFNRGTYMASLAASRMGLAPMFRDADGRIRRVRDLRMVDLDNDGDLDLAANSYWCAGEPRDRAQVYWRHPDGRFELSPGLDGLPPLTGWGETILAADFDDDGYLDLYLPGYTRHDLSPEIPECHGIAAPASGQSWLLRNRGAVGARLLRAAREDPAHADVRRLRRRLRQLLGRGRPLRAARGRAGIRLRRGRSRRRVRLRHAVPQSRRARLRARLSGTRDAARRSTRVLRSSTGITTATPISSR